MTNDREQWLQHRAYAIWESEGRPNGREHEHWEQAERELAANQSTRERTAMDAAQPEAVKTPRKRAAGTAASAAARTRKKSGTELRP
jgi:hypothetical protein